MERYEIGVAEVIDARRARALGCERIARPRQGGSLLVFIARDQTALYGLLARLRDMGVALVDVHRVEPPAAPVAEPGRKESLDVR